MTVNVHVTSIISNRQQCML